MTNKELQKKLDFLKNKLSEANKVNDVEVIDKCVDELNSLWDKAGVQMLKNKTQEDSNSESSLK